MDTEDLPSSAEQFLLGFVTADIVGLGHYSGTVRASEMVGLVRDPLNPHDENAIKVVNTGSFQLGHIERKVAAVLSPLIDSELIIVNAIVPKFRSNQFRIPCQIHIFTQIPLFPTVRDRIISGGLQLITQDDASFTLSASQAVKETKAVEQNTNVSEIFRLLDESLSSKERVIPLIEPPREVIKSELFPHQKEGLGWLVSRENSNDLPPFWEEREGEFVNILTSYKTVNRPEPLRGGILADDMGLGKTLTLLSLIALDKGSDFGIGDDGNKSEKKGSVSRKRKRNELRMNDGLKRTPTATLVVCSPSVLSTWILQLEQHTVQGSLRTYMYYGQRRTRNADELKMYDLVLTTYAMLASNEDNPIKKLEWRRIILDEAHAIKNHEAQQTKAVIALNAKRRWAVTGTPIMNGSMDLYSLMAFLHFEPFSIRSYWQSLVQRPLNMRLERGLMRLQILMAVISLRRTKDKGLVGLPPKTIETYYVELDSVERELYNQVDEATRNHILCCMNSDRLVRHYSAILSMILRLRQVCTDMALCPKDLGLLSHLNKIRDISEDPELLRKMVEKLKDVEDLGCPICLSTSTDIVFTLCAHIFCRSCILKALQCSHSRCPLCRHPLKESDLFSAHTESTTSDSSASSSSSITKPSSKTSALIKLLVESREENSAVKSIVFSQFNNMLSFLEHHLKEAGFKTLRLDGTMDAKARAKVIGQFQNGGREGPTVLLASLRASSTGINLTAASRVYFMDPWWNPAVEEQAMDRVHRIGQKEVVKVVRLIAKNSIEERILVLQDRKKELAKKPFKRGSDNVGMGITEIRFLMNMSEYMN